jgi:hypothetical protein
MFLRAILNLSLRLRAVQIQKYGHKAAAKSKSDAGAAFAHFEKRVTV